MARPRIWTLIIKNFRIAVLRRPVASAWMALLLPIILTWFLSWAQNLLIPPATYGIGHVRPVDSLAAALDVAAGSGRDKVLFVYEGDPADELGTAVNEVIDLVAAEVADAGRPVVRLGAQTELATECPTSLRGVSQCYGAVVFRPLELPAGAGLLWNYTIRSDSALISLRIDVDRADNDAEVYLLPLQRAVDAAIAAVGSPGSAAAAARDVSPRPLVRRVVEGSVLGDTVNYPFTHLTVEERRAEIRRGYQESIHNFAAVAFLSSIFVITYHLTGFVATEREIGMAQLLDSMMTLKYKWQSPAATRHVAHHVSFSAVYLPGWVVGAGIIRSLVFPDTNMGTVIVYQLFAGWALASMSILFASVFRRAQLSGITALLSTILLGILAQSLTAPDTATVGILSALFAPCNYVYFLRYVSRFQRLDRPADLQEAAPESEVAFPGIVFFALLLAQIFWYPTLGGFIESYLYSSANSPGRTVLRGPAAAAALGDVAVRLEGFTKTYHPPRTSRLFSSLSGRDRAPVVAVDRLTLDAHRGQIVALLGANGSGKSTTLDCIAGMNRITRGSVTIDGTGGLGIAPQKNVLWDELTVEEHIRIFARLKSPHAVSRREVSDLIRAVDLVQKRGAKSKTLSGGQKRKLQLGMMLAGGSAVCCVDEVSSGLDPLSRRKIWDILLAERGRRTLLLTTHFLDEADLLADHIAILSRGTLRAQGSSAELKNTAGGGYHVFAHRGHSDPAAPDVEGVARKTTLDEVEYLASSSHLAVRTIKALDAAGIRDYRFSGPTIEDVFLALAEEIRPTVAKEDEGGEVPTDNQDSESERPLAGGAPDTDTGTGTGTAVPARKGLALMDGREVGYRDQIRILFKKRLVVSRRNWPVYLAAFALPVAAAGLVTLFLHGQEPAGCAPGGREASTRSEDIATRSGLFRMSLMVGPTSGAAAFEEIARLFRLASPSDTLAGLLNSTVYVDTLDDFNAYVSANFSNTTAGLWLGDGDSPPMLAWVGSQSLGVPLLAQNLLDVLLTGQNVMASWNSFDRLWAPGTGNSLQVIVYMGIALAVYPGFFALYPSAERRRFVRALQYSNGVRPFPLWVAYLLFDWGIATVASAVAAGLWAGLSSVWWHLGYVWVVFWLYGLASVLLSYLVSLVGKSQLSTYAYVTVIQGIVFLGYLIGYLATLSNAPVDRTDEFLVILTLTIPLLAPIGSAIRAMLLTLNLFSAACDGRELAGYPGGITQYGGPILYLCIQAAAYFAVLLVAERGSFGSHVKALLSLGKGAPDAAAAAAAAHGSGSDEEVQLADEEPASREGLRVVHLTKSFGKNTAVENVTFAVPHGEVFALLGPNGAGKSTTISLIRGDVKPSRNGGDVFVEDKSVTRQLVAARRRLGVCPQIDAMDLMTVREHLEFYARVRGIRDVDHNVAEIIRAVGLGAFAARMADALSGGNKRKLSLGIALTGNPSVVLLDEPSSGLDAAAKRIMWKTLAATVTGRSLLLTTHSMEEASALAGRAGILARRMLAVGTTESLRRRFGDNLHVHLVSRTAPRTTAAEMDATAAWIRGTFPDATMEDETYHGQMRFSVPAASVLAVAGRRGGRQGRPEGERHDTGDGGEKEIVATQAAGAGSAIGKLAVILEENKEALGVEHYSVSPTTLDQVFLEIVGRHNVQEENYGQEKTGGRRWWGGRK